MTFMIKHFFRGLLIVVPAALTLYILWGVFTWIDRLLALPVRGAGFLITVVATMAIGALASNIVGRTLFSWAEQVFVRAPLVRIVYGSIKDLLEAFVGDRRRFDKPVLVRFPALGDVRALGFVTRQSLEFLSMPAHVAVYLPQSYNVAGNLLLCPSGDVERIDLDSAQLMAFVVSGGVSSFPAPQPRE